ncbi:MAG: HDIG domain-containing protein [Candidatus Eisenbacteria bacterium]|nr:HDIG domain-containing protein [Candidatus Eisenbacteria bacterium]
MGYPSRDEAWALLTEYTQSESLRKHALAVEAAMRAYARHFGEDEEQWGVVGLLHDFDYEAHPTLEEHPQKGAEILRARGCPEEMVTAILSHASHTGVPRETRMARALYAVDELTGFIIAVALVRPSKKVAEVKPKSVKKKMKDRAFARAVNRDEIREGVEELGVDFDEHVRRVVTALASIAGALGLAGPPDEDA